MQQTVTTGTAMCGHYTDKQDNSKTAPGKKGLDGSKRAKQF